MTEDKYAKLMELIEEYRRVAIQLGHEQASVFTSFYLSGVEDELRDTQAELERWCKDLIEENITLRKTLRGVSMK